MKFILCLSFLVAAASASGLYGSHVAYPAPVASAYHAAPLVHAPVHAAVHPVAAVRHLAPIHAAPLATTYSSGYGLNYGLNYGHGYDHGYGHAGVIGVHDGLYGAGFLKKKK